jgi:hypothetical protein
VDSNYPSSAEPASRFHVLNFAKASPRDPPPRTGPSGHAPGLQAESITPDGAIARTIPSSSEASPASVPMTLPVTDSAQGFANPMQSEQCRPVKRAPRVGCPAAFEIGTGWYSSRALGLPSDVPGMVLAGWHGRSEGGLLSENFTGPRMDAALWAGGSPGMSENFTPPPSAQAWRLRRH